MSQTRSLAPSDIKKILPPRPADSHKGTFGRVVAVCGTRGMSGAAYLCALAAYRTGCGLVEIVTPEENRAILQTLIPEAIVTAYDSESPSNSVIGEAVRRADAVVVGCGLGHCETSAEVLETVLTSLRSPVVIDADALNLIARRPSLLGLIRHPAIITPHPYEMSRLCGLEVSEIVARAQIIAVDYAAKNRLICVLKGHKSIISDGSEVYINQFGNSGMATGGSGDVLAGVIASLLSQLRNYDISPIETAALGVLIHSLAGDEAAKELGEYAVMASDIAARIGMVMR